MHLMEYLNEIRFALDKTGLERLTKIASTMPDEISGIFEDSDSYNLHGRLALYSLLADAGIKPEVAARSAMLFPNPSIFTHDYGDYANHLAFCVELKEHPLKYLERLAANEGKIYNDSSRCKPLSDYIKSVLLEEKKHRMILPNKYGTPEADRAAMSLDDRMLRIYNSNVEKSQDNHHESARDSFGVVHKMSDADTKRLIEHRMLDEDEYNEAKYKMLPGIGIKPGHLP